MSKIFLIAGLGADTRLYNNIDLLDNEVEPVDWIEPNECDTLNTYAQKLIHQYFIYDNSIVIGTSLGGMIAIEIARQVKLNKVILISSIKTVNEAPWYFKLFKVLPAYKLLSGRLLTNLGFLIKPVFGNMSSRDAWLFNDMLRKSSPKFIKWAIGAVLKWDNEIIPANVYHIVGDKDLVFNYKKIKNATIIKGGTHIMVFDKAKQINKLLKGILKKK
ncbi:alpha/beta hydrolase [Mucilaginibacter sp. UR6-11]|uniref:alpha/beta hydrolase n=1 Tax=Mucilaginibacter sp. UR6-11 TaxID=1435644 RepID=UPI001E63162D|nr:alpha/beta hydrolase [Mucilaginibacter sp. UR6-11]MCC8426049.1 alpha/beta hydrolase [Mucilaginibacter sp. UR6-11]